MTQVLYECTCPECGIWINDDSNEEVFHWFNPQDMKAEIVVETDDDDRQWAYCICPGCDYREMLIEEEVTQILIDKFGCVDLADYLCVVTRLLHMKKDITERYMEAR